MNYQQWRATLRQQHPSIQFVGDRKQCAAYAPSVRGRMVGFWSGKAGRIYTDEVGSQ